MHAKNLELCVVNNLITALRIEGLLGVFCTFVKTQRVPPPVFYYQSYIKRIGEESSNSSKGAFSNNNNNNKFTLTLSPHISRSSHIQSGASMKRSTKEAGKRRQNLTLAGIKTAERLQSHWSHCNKSLGLSIQIDRSSQNTKHAFAQNEIYLEATNAWPMYYIRDSSWCEDSSDDPQSPESPGLLGRWRKIVARNPVQLSR